MERPARMTTLLILVTINGGGMIMKRIIYIGFAAIMAFAFSSCQKEAEIENVNENKLVKVVLRAEKLVRPGQRPLSPTLRFLMSGPMKTRLTSGFTRSLRKQLNREPLRNIPR